MPEQTADFTFTSLPSHALSLTSIALFCLILMGSFSLYVERGMQPILRRCERAPVVFKDLCRYVEFVRDLPFVLVHAFE